MEGLELGLFYFILNSRPLTRNLTWTEKNIRRKCQMNNRSSNF